MTRSKKSKMGFGSNGKAKRNSKCKLDVKVNNGRVDDGEVEDDEIEKKNQKMSKSKNLTKSKKLFKSKKIVRFSDFLTPEARLVFIKLRQRFVKALTLNNFDLEHHI